MSITGFIIAVNAQGRKQRIPQHWLDHPVLGQGFRLPPSARRRSVTAQPIIESQPEKENA